jgi:hypothetical protein
MNLSSRIAIWTLGAVITGGILSVFFLPNYMDKEGWEYGKVVKISGNSSGLTKSSGAMFGNESVRITDNSLVYSIRTGKGEIYTISVYEGEHVSRALIASRVCLGTGISFAVRIIKGSASNTPNYHVGGESADKIFISEPCLQ